MAALASLDNAPGDAVPAVVPIRRTWNGEAAVIPVPSGYQFQPIDAREVAARLVELALGEPAGLVAEIGWPQVLGMGELIRIYLRAARRSRTAERQRQGLRQQSQDL